MSKDKKPPSDTVDQPQRRSLLRVASLVGAASMLGVHASKAQMNTTLPNAEDVLDVVIIGGGLSGLTSARDLQIAGNDSFLVLEASDRVGGRVLNHKLADGQFSEAGGQWIGPGQTAIADLARELNIDTFKSDYTGNVVYQMGNGRISINTYGGTDTDPELVAELESLAATVPSAKPWLAPNAKQLDNMSLADWLASKNLTPADTLTWHFASILTTGTAPKKLSFLYYLSMIHFAKSLQGLEGQKDGAQESRFHGGSEVIATTMAKNLGDKLQLSCPVTKIENWDTDICLVHTANHTVKARRVIIALSPPLCERINYHPALPAKRQQLQQQWPAHGPMMKTAMAYTKPFWFDEGYNGQIFSVDGPVIWSYDNSPHDKSIGIINTFVRAANMPSGHEEAKTLLSKIYAEAMADKRFLEPTEFHMHDWAKEPYAITCVSPIAPNFLTSGLMPSLTQNIGGLVWSGTETADIWNGYMDGAVRAGHRSALQVLQTL